MRTSRLVLFVLIAVCFSLHSQDTSKKTKGCFVAPVLFYTPETRLGYGAIASVFIYPNHAMKNARPSTLTPLVVYTQNKQTLLRLTHELFFRDERIRWYGTVYRRNFPDKFWGIGNRLPAENQEAYTRRDFGLWTIPQLRVASSLYAGLELEYRQQKLTQADPSGALNTGEIPGSEPNQVLGLGVNLFYDTRDNAFYALTGAYRRLHLLVYNDTWGSDYNFRQIIVDLRRFFSVGSHTLGLQGYCKAQSGRPPFHMLAGLGGPNHMRGYYEGRYRDRNMLMAQAEYKRDLWKCIDLVLFAGIGDVAHAFRNFSIHTLKPSCGAGLRFQVNPEKVSVRLDFGFGEGCFGFYVEASEAF